MFAGGLRAAAYASRHAAPLMIEQRRGLIVNITWILDRPHGHAFYEVVKNATNKLTEQFADDLRPHGVAVVAVSPGWMRLERMNLTPELAARTESPEFPGRAVAALATDPAVIERTGGVFTGLRGQRGDAVREDDEPVAFERDEGVAVVRLLARGDGPQRGGAPLAERALEPRLLAQRLVTAAARRALRRQRARMAAWDPREADRRAEVEERLRARAVEQSAGPLLDAAHVRVDRKHVAPEREVPDGGRRVRPDARQFGEN